MGKDRTHVLPLYSFLDHILACRREQRRPTPLVRRILQERPHSLHSNLPLHPIRIHSLLLLIRTHTSRMHSIDPRTLIFRTLKPRLIILHSPHHGTSEEDLGEFCASVKRVGTNVRIDFVDGGELSG